MRGHFLWSLLEEGKKEDCIAEPIHECSGLGRGFSRVRKSFLSLIGEDLLGWSGVLIVLFCLGCPSSPSPSGNDGGIADAMGEDAAPPMNRCPTMGVPEPDKQMLPCCYRFSQAAQRDRPEMRLRYLDITAPSASPISMPLAEGLLNDALSRETFNWLFRVMGAGRDGEVTIITGYGVRNDDGTYTLGTSEYMPVMLRGTIMGERVTTESELGPLRIPVFDPTGTMLQFILPLRSIRVVEATFSDNRNCIGERQGNRFRPAGVFEGFVTVDDAMGANINVPPIMSNLCSILAGEISAPSGMPPLCQRPRDEWPSKPDSICEASGCRANVEGMPQVCNPTTNCNAWRLSAQFAAVGIDIRD